MYRVVVLMMVMSFVLSEAVDVSLQQEKVLFAKYQKFMQQFNKTYNTLDEMQGKFKVFTNNLNMTERSVNKSLGVTKFMDMTPEDFQKKYLKLNVSMQLPLNNTKNWYNETKGTETKGRFLQSLGNPVPASFDWRKKGAVNEVQNQGICGGCWAFSAVANLEGLYFIKYGYLPKFSEQQLIDCDPYNSGCGGGIMGNAYEYLRTYGIQSEATYSYLFDQGYCQYNSQAANSVVSTWTSAGTDDEEYIKEMLYTTGPLAVTINASTLQYYTGGVIDVIYEECPIGPNHGVNLVGYGTSEYGQDYWIVRNTWGSDWGEEGYFRLARGRSLCGINQYVVSAILH
jgi:cathepsin F